MSMGRYQGLVARIAAMPGVKVNPLPNEVVDLFSRPLARVPDVQARLPSELWDVLMPFQVCPCHHIPVCRRIQSPHVHVAPSLVSTLDPMGSSSVLDARMCA